jgi:hypothetical protein
MTTAQINAMHRVDDVVKRTMIDMEKNRLRSKREQERAKYTTAYGPSFGQLTPWAVHTSYAADR